MGLTESQTQKAVIARIRLLLEEKKWSANYLATFSGAPQSTIKSLLNQESATCTVKTIKILCDAFGITLGEFFSHPLFDTLEQEIR